MMPYKEDRMDDKINNNELSDRDKINQNMANNNNQNTQLPPPTTGMTKAEIRKSNKPIMEKKRRARINHCLNELKTLILEAMRKDPARHTKLEKADILEMTVKHLQTIQRQQLVMAVSTDPTVVHKFKSGFIDCAEEVNRYISTIEGVDQPVKQRLMNHLNNCVSGLSQLSPYNFGGGFQNPSVIQPIHQHQNDTTIPLQQDINNNGRIQMGGVQFIPSRLPTGELALVMPNSSNLPFFPTTNLTQPTIEINPTYPRVSAFNTVTKSSRHLGTSPPLSPISSISSMGDDSSPPNDYSNIATTPPLQLQSNQNLLNVFPTPPSGGSVKSLIIPSSLQQPHISSTTETPKSSLTSVINQTNNQFNNNLLNKKRSFPTDIGNHEQPETKYIKLENTDVKPTLSNDLINNNNTNNNNHSLNNSINNNNNNYHLLHQAPSPNGEMWRPW